MRGTLDLGLGARDSEGGDEGYAVALVVLGAALGAAILGVAFLGEAMSCKNWLGIVTISGGAVLVGLKG